MSGAVHAYQAILGPDEAKIAWWQACVRAVLIFLAGIGYIRAVGARTFGKGTPLDIVVSVIIGSNLSRAIVGSAPFLTTLAATAVLIAMHWLLARVAHRWPWFSRLVKGQPHDLVRDGRVEEAELERWAITHNDLDEALREEGEESAEGVKRAVLERSGSISVIKAGPAGG